MNRFKRDDYAGALAYAMEHGTAFIIDDDGDVSSVISVPQPPKCDNCKLEIDEEDVDLFGYCGHCNEKSGWKLELVKDDGLCL